MSEQILSLSQFKADASRMLGEMKEHGDRLVLTQNGAATAVVQDVESYRRGQQALAMLKLLLQGEAEVQRGALTEQSEVFADLRKRLNENDG